MNPWTSIFKMSHTFPALELDTQTEKITTNNFVVVLHLFEVVCVSLWLFRVFVVIFHPFVIILYRFLLSTCVYPFLLVIVLHLCVNFISLSS